MRTRSVCGFFLTWVGSYENHCFEINAHTFIFQIGYPTTSGHVKVRTEATLGQVKHLEISKELMRDCLTVPVA